MTSEQNKTLNKCSGVQFVSSLKPGEKALFGIKSKPREHEPSMQAILAWGFEAPVKNDYTKDDADISNKIRKRERYQISEAHDNFRNPNDKDAHLLLANYFESDEMTLFKKKWLEWHEDKEN